MTCIPCQRNAETKARIDELAERLSSDAHEWDRLGLSKTELYDHGLFRGAIERIRGQLSSDMSEKKYFCRLILERLREEKLVREYESAGGQNRFDYKVELASGRVAVIELKGCLDGNNTNIFERPAGANEFYIWSVCQNAAADPRKNAWSGVHSRLSAEIVDKEKQVDGLIIWDMVCGSMGRPCPKLIAEPDRATEIGPYKLPPPCLYLFPSTIPNARNNQAPRPHRIGDLEFMAAMQKTFGVRDDELYSVQIEAKYQGSELARRTIVTRAGVIERESNWNAIRRR